METWMLLPLGILVIGVAVVAYGALHDRTRRRAEEAQLHSAPERDIPGLRHDAAAPSYVTAEGARRSPGGTAREMSGRERTALATDLESTDPFAYGFADDGFVTDSPTRRAVLDEPRVLVCADPITSVREVLNPLERLTATEVGLVLMAPSFGAEVVDTLAVNVIQQRLRVVAVAVDDDAVRAAVAARSGATEVPGTDLQAGYLPDDHLGHAARWVSTATQSWLLPVASVQP
ncbi:hypothetical protein [Microlunatus sp. Y2014]|uniref:hypothetical protein n=1 Tax=Microlunatus sp. Y2014 TaxID=3418488 RepID=UPI003DA75A1D